MGICPPTSRAHHAQVRVPGAGAPPPSWRGMRSRFLNGGEQKPLRRPDPPNTLPGDAGGGAGHPRSGLEAPVKGFYIPQVCPRHPLDASQSSTSLSAHLQGLLEPHPHAKLSPWGLRDPPNGATLWPSYRKGHSLSLSGQSLRPPPPARQEEGAALGLTCISLLLALGDGGPRRVGRGPPALAPDLYSIHACWGAKGPVSKPAATGKRVKEPPPPLYF